MQKIVIPRAFSADHYIGTQKELIQEILSRPDPETTGPDTPLAVKRLGSHRNFPVTYYEILETREQAENRYFLKLYHKLHRDSTGFNLARNEFETLTQLDCCSRIPQAFALGVDAGRGRAAVLLEHLGNGETLDRIIEKKKHFTEEELWDWMLQLLKAVVKINKRGYLWLDCKPNNIFRTTVDHTLRPFDFGISKRLVDRSGSIGHTPGYAPPEQIGGQGDHNKVDIFSVGATIAHAALGTKLPEETSYESFNLIERLVEGGYSETFAGILAKLAEPEAERRPFPDEAWEAVLAAAQEMSLRGRLRCVVVEGNVSYEVSGERSTPRFSLRRKTPRLCGWQQPIWDMRDLRDVVPTVQQISSTQREEIIQFLLARVPSLDPRLVPNEPENLATWLSDCLECADEGGIDYGFAPYLKQKMSAVLVRPVIATLLLLLFGVYLVAVPLIRIVKSFVKWLLEEDK